MLVQTFELELQIIYAQSIVIVFIKEKYKHVPNKVLPNISSYLSKL